MPRSIAALAFGFALGLTPFADCAPAPDHRQEEISSTHGDRFISGVYPHLTTYDGNQREVVEYRQFTDVTGPEGVRPTSAGANLPQWTIGTA
ncbi:MAG: hypothetical protein K9N23_18430 [Akkermansiaceae bacterium]|nr:hypothetical protein [Akkermansiaceae bacterium]